MKEVATAAANITKQIRMISLANKDHSGGTARVLGQLKNVRAVSERNTQGVQETRGSTTDLVAQAEALRSSLQRSGSAGGRQPRRNGSNGRS
jgi:methyl-accepting chemotaxis protein